MGRGLQRNQIEKHGLIDFNSDLKERLDVPVIDIKRGGGLTFHHPGQIIIYPILHIAHQKIKTIELINQVFKKVTDGIKTFDNSIGEPDFDRPLLGIWNGDKKLASMGIQLKRFVSMHGLALNTLPSPEMKNALLMTYLLQTAR